jgi:hypothetical protein
MPNQINEACKCPSQCSRHGDCRACQEYHLKNGSKTNCGKDGKSKESK